MFLGNEGCIIGLCESWLSKLMFGFCYWFACIGLAIELMPVIAAELNCGVNMVYYPGSMNLCWGAKEDNRSDCIGDAPTPKNGIWLLTCIDWGMEELTICLGDKSGLTRFYTYCCWSCITLFSNFLKAVMLSSRSRPCWGPSLRLGSALMIWLERLLRPV